MTASKRARPAYWSLTTIVLHWLSAVLILALLGLGWFMVRGDLDAGTKFDLYQLHKSLGFLSLALLLLRLCSRFAQPSPAFPAAMPEWEQRLAGLTHVTFYALLAAAVLTGWVLVSAAIIAIPTQFFNLFVIPNLVGANAALQADMTFAHYVISRLLMALVALHVAAALKHHFLDRDDILRRMSGSR